MPATGPESGTRSARSAEGPLTDPRYLFASDAETLASLASAGLNECRKRLDEIVAVPSPRTLETLLVPYDRLVLALNELLGQAQFLFNVHPDGSVRETADKWYQEGRRFATELSLNRPLYDAFVALDVSDEDAETRYAVHKILRDFRLAGVDRDESVRARIQELQDEITAIGQTFERAIREDVRTIPLDGPEGLDGLPEDFIRSHPPGPDGTIRITTNYPDSIPVLRFAKDPEVRRKLQREYLNRGYPANLEVLSKLLARRHELARLLGYESFAEYVVQDKMIGSAKAIAEFLGKVTRSSTERAQDDHRRLLDRKRKDVHDAAHLDAWDVNYYTELVRAESFAFDAKVLREYFAFSKVRDGLFALTSELFGVRYERVTGLPVWHESVEVYDVHEGTRRIGRVYLDLHPRKDKYTHAAAQGLVTGIRGVQLPQAALMCNFPDPREGPALMDHSEVEAFFHEFGHLLHAVFMGHGRWVKNTDDGIEWDFIEAPSQMLEEWMRDPEVLRTFAHHHKTGEPVPADLVAKLRRADAVSRALDVHRQLVFGTLSLRYYDGDPTGLDTTKAIEDVYARFPLVPLHAGTHFQCSFGHLNGYSAAYYTYMWSLVIAKDLFSKFREGKSILDPDVARRYRERILAPGSAKPAAELVEDFLGRPLAFDAFEDWLTKEGR